MIFLSGCKGFLLGFLHLLPVIKNNLAAVHWKSIEKYKKVDSGDIFYYLSFFYQNRLYHEWSIFSEIKIISLCCSLKIAGSSLQIRWLISVWQVPIILSLFSMRMSAIHIELFNFSNQGYVKSTEMSKTAISCNPIPSMCKTDLQKPHS